MDQGIVSLETLLEQERQYTDIAVARIMTCAPNVLVLSGYASKLALDRLIAHGVTVLLNTKESCMKRLSRLTGARILASLHHIDKVRRVNCAEGSPEGTRTSSSHARFATES